MRGRTATDSLGHHASRGALNTLIWQGVRACTQLLSVVVLARLLTPDDFGLFVMATSIVGIGEIIRNFGLYWAAVQAPSLSQAEKSNLFWLNSLIGLGVAVVAAATAPLVAVLYGRPELTPITMVLSVTFLFTGISTQFRAELSRGLRFSAFNISDAGPPVIGLVVGVILAWATHSYWALVIQQVVVAALGTVLAALLSRWLPSRPDRHTSVRRFVSFGAAVLGTETLRYGYQNADTIGIGVVWGAEVLGIYSRAYALLLAPIYQMLTPLTRVAVPVLARMRDTPDRFVVYLDRGQLATSIGAGTLLALLFGTADSIVFIVFGAQWMSLVPIFQVLCIGGVFIALSFISTWMFLSLGRSADQLRYSLVARPLQIALLLAGLPWGGVGVAVGFAVGAALNWIAALLWAARVSGISTRKILLHGSFTTLALTIPLGASAWLGAQIASDSVWLSLAMSLGFGAIYIAFCYVAIPGLRRDLRAVWNVLRSALVRTRR